jgi:hypothetical protein
MHDTLNSSEPLRFTAFQRVARFLHLELPEVWVRFLLAIVGLVLAFAAALFSTVSRESGNLWATLILASAALLLAVIVGLTTVPYLMRRVTAARLRDAFEYHVTAAGIGYVVCVVLLSIAALNTGNNLLYIIVAAMLAAILVSGIASAFDLRDLELDVRVPEHVFAGRGVLGRILLHNPRRWLPAFSIQVAVSQSEKSARHWRWVQSTFAFPPGRPPEKQWLRLPDRKLSLRSDSHVLPAIFDGCVYFPYLPAHSELRADLDLRFARRGRYQQENFALRTRFPFALLTKIRRIPLIREIIVYPSVEPTDDFFEVLPLITGEFETFIRGLVTGKLRPSPARLKFENLAARMSASSASFLTIRLPAKSRLRPTSEPSPSQPRSVGISLGRTPTCLSWPQTTTEIPIRIASWPTWLNCNPRQHNQLSTPSNPPSITTSSSPPVLAALFPLPYGLALTSFSWERRTGNPSTPESRLGGTGRPHHKIHIFLFCNGRFSSYTHAREFESGAPK